MLTIVPVYAAFLALMFVVLSVRVIGLRRSSKVSIGHAGNVVLQRRMRVQGNFAEYVPFALLLLTFVELKNWPVWLVHGLALLLVAGRLSHAVGIGNPNEDYRFRVTGMALTFTVIGISALLLLASIGDLR